MGSALFKYVSIAFSSGDVRSRSVVIGKGQRAVREKLEVVVWLDADVEEGRDLSLVGFVEICERCFEDRLRGYHRRRWERKENSWTWR
jgi:hypothetical protein